MICWQDPHPLCLMLHKMLDPCWSRMNFESLVVIKTVVSSGQAYEFFMAFGTHVSFYIVTFAIMINYGWNVQIISWCDSNIYRSRLYCFEWQLQLHSQTHDSTMWREYQQPSTFLMGLVLILRERITWHDGRIYIHLSFLVTVVSLSKWWSVDVIRVWCDWLCHWELLYSLTKGSMMWQEYPQPIYLVLT